MPNFRFSFLHKSISRSDPLYFDAGAVQARIDEWTKLPEFHCFEENEFANLEKLTSMRKEIFLHRE